MNVDAARDEYDLRCVSRAVSRSIPRWQRRSSIRVERAHVLRRLHHRPRFAHIAARVQPGGRRRIVDVAAVGFELEGNPGPRKPLKYVPGSAVHERLPSAERNNGISDVHLLRDGQRLSANARRSTFYRDPTLQQARHGRRSDSSAAGDEERGVYASTERRHGQGLRSLR